MNRTTHTISTAVLCAASLGVSACQRSVTLGLGLGDAEQSVCAHGTLEHLLDDGVGFAQDLALRGGNLLWYTGLGDTLDPPPPKVMRAPESGGTPVVVAQSGGVALFDDQNVFWIRGNFDDHGVAVSWSVVAAPQSGGAKTTLYTSTTNGGELLAVDRENVYVAYDANDHGLEQRTISVPKTGGTPVLLTALKPPTFVDDWNFCVDDQSFYYEKNGQFWSQPKSGGSPIALAPSDSEHFWLQDATRFYGVRYTENRDLVDVVSVSKSGGAVTTIASAIPAPQTMGSDDECLYLPSVLDNVLIAVPKDGGQAVAAAALPKEDTAPTGVVADATGVYISDVNGFVLKLAR
jgi:hypothetical protein